MIAGLTKIMIFRSMTRGISNQNCIFDIRTPFKFQALCKSSCHLFASIISPIAFDLFNKTLKLIDCSKFEFFIHSCVLAISISEKSQPKARIFIIFIDILYSFTESFLTLIFPTIHRTGHVHDKQQIDVKIFKNEGNRSRKGSFYGVIIINLKILKSSL